MAQVTTINPIDTIRGELVHRSGLIFRRKHAYDENGKVIHKGKLEVYKVCNPRDFKKNPPRGNEKLHLDLWREACRRAAIEAKPDHPLYASWRERWHNQLNKPDPLCPPCRQTGKPRSYWQFDCFVRVAILWDLRKQS